MDRHRVQRRARVGLCRRPASVAMETGTGADRWLTIIPLAHSLTFQPNKNKLAHVHRRLAPEPLRPRKLANSLSFFATT